MSVFILLIPFLFGFFLKRYGITRVKGAWIYESLLILSGISLQCTGSEKLYFLTAVMIVSLLFLYVMLYYQKTEAPFACSIRKYTHFLAGILENLLTPVQEWMAGRKSAGNAGEKEREAEKGRKRKEVFCGILIAVPLSGFVLILLAGADAVFADMLHGALTGIFHFQFGKIFSQTAGIMILLFCFAFFVFSGVFSSILKYRDEQETVTAQSSRTMVPVVYSSLILGIYVLFSGIQIYYLFLRKGTIPAGITYASYAREGFFQLLFLCIFNFLFILYGKRKYEEKLLLNLIYSGIVFCTYIMIASSAYRMFLYIRSYDLTFLRIFVLWCLAGLAFMFTEILYFLLRRKTLQMHIFWITAFVFCLFFIFSRPDSAVVKYNFNPQRYHSVQEMAADADFYILKDTSSDALSYIAELDHELEKTADYRKGEASFDQIHAYMDRFLKKRPDTYRNFNISKYLAGVQAEQQL